MAEETKPLKSGLSIMKCADGGFVVTESYSSSPGLVSPPLFAGEIGAVLDYVGDAMSEGYGKAEATPVNLDRYDYSERPEDREGRFKLFEAAETASAATAEYNEATRETRLGWRLHAQGHNPAPDAVVDVELANGNFRSAVKSKHLDWASGHQTRITAWRFAKPPTGF